MSAKKTPAKKVAKKAAAKKAVAKKAPAKKAAPSKSTFGMFETKRSVRRTSGTGPRRK
jgi:hypothetical protein